MARRHKSSALLLCVLWLGAGCRRASQPPLEPGAPRPAPSFELKDLSGKPVRLEDFRGKVVLLDFWATYCVPCHESIPLFERLYDKYKAQGLEVVGVDLDAFTQRVPEFVKEHGMTYTVVLDSENAAQESYGIRGLPTTLLLDRKGDIRRQWLGFDETVAAEVQDAVGSLLQEK